MNGMKIKNGIIIDGVLHEMVESFNIIVGK